MDISEKTTEFSYRHPWEIVRRDQLCAMVYSSDRGLRYADIGSGDMYVIDRIREFSDKKIIAVDSNFQQHHFRDDLEMFHDVDTLEKSSVDRMLLLDVLEHIEHDDTFIGRLSELLVDGGYLLITVPAFQFLFTPHDEYLEHFRRYTLSRLEKMTRSHGLVTAEKFYFFSGPFIIRCIELFCYRLGLKKKFGRVVSEWSHEETSLISWFYRTLLTVDFAANRLLARLNLHLPGLSVCLMCRKKFA